MVIRLFMLNREVFFPVKRLLRAIPSCKMGREEEHYSIDIISFMGGIALSNWQNMKFLDQINFVQVQNGDRINLMVPPDSLTKTSLFCNLEI